MIQGAGTISEKQFYTYTDTTACCQPNVVYYYQIEDVSLDGKITLSPPARPIVTEQASALAAATDVVGNHTDDGTATWALPMNDDLADVA